MTQDWNRMLKSFRTKTYRNLQEDPAAAAAVAAAAVAASATNVDWIDNLVDECRPDTEEKFNDWEKPTRPSPSPSGSQLLATTRARSASEPSFLSASRAVVVPHHAQLALFGSTLRSTTTSLANQRSSHTPPTVREISSITGLQQQIKAAFGRWRKRGGPSTSSSPPPSSEEESPSTASCSSGQPLREDVFSHPLNVRVSAQSQTFSHPHRLTVFPPFPSPNSSSTANTGNSKANTSSSNNNNNRPFSFVRGLRKRRGGNNTAGDSNTTESLSIGSESRDRCRADNSWSGCSIGGQDPFGAYPLAAKSKSDHSLHRILKEENTWTVFATLRPPNEKGGSLSKGSTAWTFGLFSGDTPPTASSLSSSHHRHRQTGFVSSGKNRASSVAPSPELIHRSFTPTPTATACIPQATLLPSFLVRNERRTRSLERCSHQRVQQRSSPANPSSSSSSSTAAYVTKPPTTGSSVRSRSLERTYQISTKRVGSGSGAGIQPGQGKTSSSLIQQAANPGAPPQLPSRRNQVPPEVLATWCTFNEAFGSGKPSSNNNTSRSRPQPPLPPPPACEPFAVLSDERDSPGSPVFEELFLPPPQRFSESSGAIGNKRNSYAGSGSCSCSCSGGGGGGGRGTPCCGHSAACSSRSSPVPPTGCSSHSGQPETVLYGTREAPVLERHCVEGGEFIIAWLSHSGSPSSSSGAGSSSGGGGGGNANNNNSNNSKSSTPPYPRTVPLLAADMHSSGASGGAATNGGGGGGTSNGAGSNRSFINKPARGWLHSDAVIVREGITYFVRYIGCLEVNTSMKSLDFDTRSQIAKECINLVCETAGLKTVDKKRKVDRRIQRILGDSPHMEHAGSDVALTISSGCLRISTLEGSTVVACHDMPNISFASGGDPDTLDFVAYVAKDNVHGRACYVLECGGGLAQDVITTVGQAFELRFKEYLKRTPRPGATVAATAETIMAESASANSGTLAASHPQWTPDDPEYYNDLPGKVPPDVSGPPPVPPLPNYQAPGGGPAASSTTAAAAAGLVAKKAAAQRHGHAVDLSDNLIDLNADVPVLSRTDGASGTSGVSGASGGLPPFSDHEYVNGIMGSSNTNQKNPSSKDPFDMHPFSSTLPSPLPSALLSPSGGFPSTMKGGVVTMQRGGLKAVKPRGASVLEAQLSQEVWFHGPISRKEAEDLLKHDGDFLVRESQGSQGQYVLTGMQSGHHKHLLLVDPEGVVRTKDRTFESVSHLINYHRNNILPIISAESVLLLKRPVSRPHHS